MTTATILSIVFNFVTHGDHIYKAIWKLDIGGHSELWVKNRDNHNTFAVVVIMIEYIVGHVLKAITYHYLLLKIFTCNTIWGCATIKINHENKVICTRIVMHWATIRICTTNRVNTLPQATYVMCKPIFLNKGGNSNCWELWTSIWYYTAWHAVSG